VKLLSLEQPYASLIAIGLKQWVSHSWRTSYRGPLVIHANVADARFGAALRRRPWVEAALARAGFPPDAELPHGAVIAIGQLVACLPADRAELSARELELGDYSDGRFAWRLESMRRLAQPVPRRGRVGLWEWPGAERMMEAAQPVAGSLCSPERARLGR